MNDPLRVLLVDNDEDDYLLLKELFAGQAKSGTKLRYDLDWVSTYEEALREFSACHYDVYLMHAQLAIQSGLNLLREPTIRECASPVILLTEQGYEEVELTAMQLGAADSLNEDQLSWPLIEHSIRYAIDRKVVEEYLKSLLHERTQVLAQLQRQAQELNALQKATSSLIKTLDIPSLLGQIMDAAQEAIPSAERVWLHLVDDNKSRSKYWSDGESRDPRIHRMELPESSSSGLKAMKEGQPLLVEDIHDEPLLLSLLDKDQEGIAVRSVIFAPLVVGQQFFGAISLGAISRSAFTEQDLRLLTSFATTASAAIQNGVLYAQTQELATTDPLTGRFNRRALFGLGNREIERHRRLGHLLSALMFDVDEFKHVNDTYGHAVGDQVLVTLSDRCARVIRNVDILGRLGGDEFAVLLPDADLETAKEIADRIRATISEVPVTTDAGPISITVSVGVVEATRAVRDLSDLLNKADQALYQSKQAGRDRTSSSPNE